MKIKIILGLIAVAIVTLSFASSNRTSTKTVKEATSSTVTSEPIGGFISEDKL